MRDPSADDISARVCEAIKTEVEAATSVEDKPAVSAPQEETKPDAHTH